MGKNTRMRQWINYRVRVISTDGRAFVGTFSAFDRHLNVVLADTEEFRKIKNKNEEQKEVKRSLGLILLRGENIVSLAAEAPPASQGKRKAAAPVPGRGIPAGRGVPVAAMGAPAGLAAPVKGVGMPGMPAHPQ